MTQCEHGQQGGVASLVAEVVAELAARELGARLGFCGHELCLLAVEDIVAHEGEGYASEVRAASETRYHHVGILARHLHLLFRFEAGMLFSRTEGIIPAPESCHAIAATIREALKCKQAGEEKVILFNLSGHGLIDMPSYEAYIKGDLQ